MRRRTILMVLLVGLLTCEAGLAANWKLTGYLRAARQSPTATLLPSGKVLVTGGEDETPLTLASAELYDPRAGSWANTAPLLEPRLAHTATLLSSGKVLVAGGGNTVSSAEIYDPASETWTPTGSLATPRGGHTATLLPTGEVLVVGGFNGGFLASAEIYDPDLGTWASTPPLPTARNLHTATLLPSGEVLIAGGWNGGSPFSSVEIFDPSTETWTTVQSMNAARRNHTATLLSSGDVLVAGGFDASFLTSAEIYDPDTGTWTPTGSMNNPRFEHSAVLLPSGQILVVAGRDSFPVSSAELFDPNSGTWAIIDSLSVKRRRAPATLLPSGEVLVIGGRMPGAALSIVEILDMGTATWTDTGSLSAPRRGHAATLLLSGEVLVAGGENSAGNLASVKAFNPNTGTWAAVGPLDTPRFRPSATLLPSGEVLVAGGSIPGLYLSSAEIFNPITRSWSPTGSLTTGRYWHTATRLASGEILVAGGWNFGALTSAELYDPVTGTWTETGSLATARAEGFTATLLPSGHVLVAGGGGGGSVLSTAEIYDPETETWGDTGSLAAPRVNHSATLLPSGKVLVVGGWSDGPLSSAEIFDPGTGTWSPVDSMSAARSAHTATLLPSGKVVVAGGRANVSLSSAETYDPTTGTWASTDALAHPRHGYTATLLASGEILVAGGSDDNQEPLFSNTEIFTPSTGPASRRPEILSTPSSMRYGQSFVITGTNFRGDSEAGSGNTQSSAVNYPLVHLRALDGTRHAWLSPDPRTSFHDDPMTLTISKLPPTLNPGPHLVSVVTAGVWSETRLVELECSLAIVEQPADDAVPIGENAVFTVDAQGGRHLQWQRNGIDIPGATDSTYITPPVAAADSGTTYRVVADSGCTSATSDDAVLKVLEEEPPEALVLAPSGGEYWLLSEDGEPENVEQIVWEMSDNVRVCQVELALLYSDDGVTWFEAPAGGNLPWTLGTSGSCAHPGLETTGRDYTLPTEPPSGSLGSQYKVRLRVTDAAGNTTEVRSERPFTLANPDSRAKTLILTNIPRMRARMGVTAGEAAELDAKIHDLAVHPDVEGLVVDLSSGPGTPLANLYDAWDADPGDPAKANAVLFDAFGVHEILLNRFAAFPDVENVLVVGDDRIVPFARVPDRTALLPESTYTDGGDLTPDGTTVGRALAAGTYLSDDLLAVLAPVASADVGERTFLPDLALGRLVETPPEIVGAITVFLNQNGILDLTAFDPVTGHKALVTGYDFLIDSAKGIRGRWKDAFGAPHVDDDLEPVDGQLISRTWGETTIEGRRQALAEHLGGNGGDRYGVCSMNGHATHYEEGVPGANQFDIQGLDTSEIQVLELAGSVVYAVGCHGGLPVADTDASAADHPLDLPQTLLGRGVQGYVANTGYGWGLKNGVGYSERLVVLFTEELLAGDTVELGEALVRAKRRYFLETSRFDADDPSRLGPYDEKTVQQWAFFGFPMYAVRTGSAVRRERSDAVTVTRREGVSALPPFVTRLDLGFDLSAPGVYSKVTAAGDAVPDASPCPDPEGCYYRLNGLSTGVTDLPIQPYTTYDSRLAGTSQHGVLWRGGRYREEADWTPVFATLASNLDVGTDNHGSTPRVIIDRPGGPGGLPGGCEAVDDELAHVVLATGELVEDPAVTGVYSERLYLDVDLEVFYFNNTVDGTGNCDRLGPAFLGGSYHQATGPTIDWAVPVEDESGVWQVLVVYNDNTVDAAGVGHWVPLELWDDGSGTWRGSVTFAEAERVTYVLQAVDTRGNVAWVDYVSADLPASKVPLGVPETMDVGLDPGEADLTVDLADTPDPVMTGAPLRYDVVVESLGPGVSVMPRLELTLPPEVIYGAPAAETGWTCRHDAAANVVTCSRPAFEIGASSFSVFVTAPEQTGPLTATATVVAENDAVTSNDVAVEETAVIDNTMGDLAVFCLDSGLPVMAGDPIGYQVTVLNQGPTFVGNARITVRLPVEMSGVSWTCEGSGCAAATGSGDIDETVDLKVGATVSYIVTGVLTAGASGEITTLATVTLPPGMTDYDPGDNTSQVTTEVALFADGFETGNLSRWSSTSE